MMPTHRDQTGSGHWARSGCAARQAVRLSAARCSESLISACVGGGTLGHCLLGSV